MKTGAQKLLQMCIYVPVVVSILDIANVSGSHFPCFMILSDADQGYHFRRLSGRFWTKGIGEETAMFKKHWNHFISLFLVAVWLLSGFTSLAAGNEFITIDKTVYGAGELISLQIFNADFSGENSFVEIVDNDNHVLIHRQIITQSNVSLNAPRYNGNYMVRVVLSDNTYTKVFRVEGSKLPDFKTYGRIIKNDKDETIAFELTWDSQGEGVSYRVVRSQANGNEMTYDSIEDNRFLDINIISNQIYTYTVYANGNQANPLVVYIAEVKPSAFVEGELAGAIELWINNPKMNVNNKRVDVYPGESHYPIIINGRTMLPIRAVVEAMGGTVSWNDSTRRTTITFNKNSLMMTNDEHSMSLNGNPITFDVAPSIIRSRTYVPLALLRHLGCEVEWIGETKQVIVKYPL